MYILASQEERVDADEIGLAALGPSFYFMKFRKLDPFSILEMSPYNGGIPSG